MESYSDFRLKNNWKVVRVRVTIQGPRGTDPYQ
jgi:hypothetical protein